ncbi:MAG: glycosyltransferase family 2 protein [bacterium]
MAKSPLISIIMNCYNSDKYLKEAIDSAYAQTYPNWEIIFYDNQSTDNSAKIAQSYDKRLRYILADKHSNLAIARNKAFSHAKGELIAFLDCDDVWYPEKLATQVPHFVQDPDLSILYGNEYINNVVRGSKYLFFKEKQPSGFVFKAALDHYPVSILMAVVRKSCLDKLDYVFDEKVLYCNDYDLFMRILMQHKAMFLDQPLGETRWHIDNCSNRFKEALVDDTLYSLNKFKHMPMMSCYHDALNKSIDNNKLKKVYARLQTDKRLLNYLAAVIKIKRIYLWPRALFFMMTFFKISLRACWRSIRSKT